LWIYLLADNNGIGTFQSGYDHIIRCLGFQFDFSIFTHPANPIPDDTKKYPDLLTNYESSSVPNMFFGKLSCFLLCSPYMAMSAPLLCTRHCRVSLPLLYLFTHTHLAHVKYQHVICIGSSRMNGEEGWGHEIHSVVWMNYLYQQLNGCFLNKIYDCSIRVSWFSKGGGALALMFSSAG